MENQKITNCPNCSARLRVPAITHIRFSCPYCRAKYEMIDGRFVDDLIDESKRKKKSSFVRKTFIWAMVAVAFFVIGFFIYPIITAPQNIYETEAYALKDSVWNSFRKTYPYQFQMVGISQYGDGSNLLIISEPPTHVTEEGVNKILRSYNYDLSVKQHPIGYDGWVKDIVVSVNGLSPKKLDKLLDKIQTYLFHTDYKAYTLPIDSLVKCEQENFLPDNLNYQVSAAEIQKWFINEDEKFAKDSIDAPKTIIEIINYANDGIFYSVNPGFVVWSLPRKTLIDDRKAAARKFVLDTDLILGAIANHHRVAIIGKERSTSVVDLPPLRVETIALLASTDNEHLAQSYERNHLLAGKQKGGKDWAPILLSDELWHTEYGNLLNITDQILKSWSMNGSIEYENFEYEKPVEWAFGKSVMADLNVNQITFNWNTSGAGYTIEDNYNIYALNRTGSLPVSYIPDGNNNITSSNKVYLAEEKAYDFFSNLNNADLVRVVQYASLYQIFRNFEVKWSESLMANTLNSKILEEGAYDVVQKIMSDEELRKMALIRPYVKYLEDLQEDKFLKYFTYAGYTMNSRNVEDVVENPLEVYKEDLESRIKKPKSNNLYYYSRPIIGAISLTEAQELYNEYQEYFYQEYNRYRQTAPVLNYLSNRYVDKDSIKNVYVNDNSESCSTWIKCPTIVQSWNKQDSVNSVGGHNLDSRITPIKIDNTLKRGQYKVVKDANGMKTVFIAKADKGMISPQLLRNIERTGVEGSNYFSKASATVRSRADVFPNVMRNKRGLNNDHLLVSDRGNFILVGDKKISNHSEIVETLLKENRSGRIIFENFNANEVKAIMMNADNITQTAVIGKLDPKKMNVFSEAFAKLDYSRVGESRLLENNLIEVHIPFKTVNVSGVKLSFQKRFYNQIKDIFKKLLSKKSKDPFLEFRKELKELNIPENEVKMQIINEIQKGKFVENTIKSSNDGIFYIKPYAA